jgi:hypothetical protein
VRKEAEIIVEKTDGSQSLFRSVGRDGIDWQFVVGSDGGWAITRNGNQVGRGTGSQASIDGGVRKFMSLTRGTVGSDAACDSVVGPLIDRIERGTSATAKVAKYQPTLRPQASVSI